MSYRAGSEIGENMSCKINQVEAKKMMDKEPDITIVDVRDEEELAEGYIYNSILLPLDEVDKRAEEVLVNKDKPILVYCRSGRRSAIACRILDNKGYKNVYDFGGIIDWPFEKVF